MLLICLPMQAAYACSCVRGQVAGFIHHDVTVLPANAVGVLFHARDEKAFDPAAFSITADQAPIAVRLEAVKLADDHPMQARLPRDGTLVRVIPAQGFRPGAHYRVRYRPASADLGARYLEMAFSIDSARLDLAHTAFTLALDGPVKSTVLPMAQSGSCSEPRDVRTQAFTVKLAPAMQRYAPALSMFAESRDVIEDHGGKHGADGPYTAVQYRDSVCTRPTFGRSMSERLVRSCADPAGKVQLRSWVGMLELGDDFVATAPVQVDLGAARPASCSGYAMLREALQRGDAAEADHLVCALASSRSTRIGDLTDADGPSTRQWLAMARHPNPNTAACAHGALANMVLLSARSTAGLRASYLAVSGEELRAADPARVVAATNRIALTQRMMRHQASIQFIGWQPDTLAPLAPQLLALAEREEYVGDAGMRVLAAIGPAAHAAVPALLDLIERGRSAEQAIVALAAVAPDDPAAHEALLRFAERADVGETAALAFARSAGAKRPQDALRLLIPLAREQNAAAVDALAELGEAAQPATPVLLELAQRSDAYVLERIVAALLAVGSDTPEVVAALVQAAAKVNVMSTFASGIPNILRFKNNASGFAPVLDSVIDRAHMPEARAPLRELIGLMRLAPAEQARLLNRLSPCAKQAQTKCQW